MKLFFSVIFFLFSVSIFAADAEEKEFLLSDGEPQDLVFIVGREGRKERIEAHIKKINASTSPCLATIIAELKPNDNHIVEMPLDVDQPKIFRSIVKFLYDGNIDFGRAQNLVDFIRYAHKFEFTTLGNKIVDHLQFNRQEFFTNLNVHDMENIVQKLKEASGLNKPENNKNSDFWAQRAFRYAIDYVLASYLADDDRKLLKKLRKIFKNDPLIYSELTQVHPTHWNSLVPMAEQIKNDIAEKMAENIALIIVNPKFKKMKDENKHVEIKVKASLATNLEAALKKELADFGVSIEGDPTPYEHPDHRIYRRALGNVNTFDNGFGLCWARCIAHTLEHAGLQCLQALTCGCFGCCFTERKWTLQKACCDDRTGYTIFACLRCCSKNINTCIEGPTKYIYIYRK